MVIDVLQNGSGLVLGVTGEALEDGLAKAVCGVLEILEILLHQAVGRAAQNSLLEDGLLGDEAVNQRVNVAGDRNDGVGDLLLVG